MMSLDGITFTEFNGEVKAIKDVIEEFRESCGVLTEKEKEIKKDYKERIHPRRIHRNNRIVYKDSLYHEKENLNSAKKVRIIKLRGKNPGVVTQKILNFLNDPSNNQYYTSKEIAENQHIPITTIRNTLLLLSKGNFGLICEQIPKGRNHRLTNVYRSTRFIKAQDALIYLTNQRKAYRKAKLHFLNEKSTPKKLSLNANRIDDFAILLHTKLGISSIAWAYEKESIQAIYHDLVIWMNQNKLDLNVPHIVDFIDRIQSIVKIHHNMKEKVED